jgi:hypothetical protein
VLVPVPLYNFGTLWEQLAGLRYARELVHDLRQAQLRIMRRIAVLSIHIRDILLETNL